MNDYDFLIGIMVNEYMNMDERNNCNCRVCGSTDILLSLEKELERNRGL